MQGDTTGRRWTREEVLKVLALYCITPFGRFHRTNPDVVRLAGELGRTPSSIAMKLSNLASLDPTERARGVAGLDGASTLDRAVWKEFYGHWGTLADEIPSEQPVEVNVAAEPPLRVPEGPTSNERLVRVRRGQNFFRRAVLAAYSEHCCITGIAEPKLLRASHIVRWADSEEHRLNPANGLCLNALHDAAYEEGLIALDDDMRLLLSRRLSESIPKDVLSDSFERYEGRSITPPTRFAPNPAFLRKHRTERFHG